MLLGGMVRLDVESWSWRHLVSWRGSHYPRTVSPGLDAGLVQAGLSCWGMARDAVLDCGVFFCFLAVFLIDGRDGELSSAFAGALLRVEHTVSCLW